MRRRIRTELMLIVTMILILQPMIISQSQSLQKDQKIDRLAKFYERLNQPDVKYCEDRTKLMPNCEICIPGLRSDDKSANNRSTSYMISKQSKSACNDFIPSSRAIRDEIKYLVLKKFGDSVPRNRLFGLYPCKQMLRCIYDVQ